MQIMHYLKWFLDSLCQLVPLGDNNSSLIGVTVLDLHVSSWERIFVHLNNKLMYQRSTSKLCNQVINNSNILFNKNWLSKYWKISPIASVSLMMYLHFDFYHLGIRVQHEVWTKLKVHELLKNRYIFNLKCSIRNWTVGQKWAHWR